MLLTTEVMYRGKLVKYENLKHHSMIKLQVECDRCHKVFTSTKYQLERNGHQFCQQCALHIKKAKDLPVGAKYNRLTVLAPAERAGYSVVQCECGTIKEVENSQLTSGRTKSCGCYQRECATENIKHAHFSGAEHWNWKGGICTPRQIFDGTPRKKFQHDVLERDNHTCQCCGSKENLNSHHIVSFGVNPDLAADVSNGITLCAKCHRKLHKIYGLKTIRDNLVEFLANHSKAGE